MSGTGVSIAFDRAVKLAEDTGVKLVVRPVLPMVMRGVPATREKGMYIFSDTVREALEAGVPYGNFYDPIGNPVRRCYSLYPWACQQGRGNELLSSFSSAADGHARIERTLIDINIQGGGQDGQVTGVIDTRFLYGFRTERVYSYRNILQALGALGGSNDNFL